MSPHDPAHASPDPITRRAALGRAAALFGVALSPSLLARVLEARDAPPPATAAGSLDAARMATVTALADRILPRTDTPGAVDVGVPAFIATLRDGFLSPAETTRLDAALDFFESAARRGHQREFSALGPSEQDALLTATAASATERDAFVCVREWIVIGYFTSEPVAREVLHYNPVPGPYEGCVPVDDR